MLREITEKARMQTSQKNEEIAARMFEVLKRIAAESQTNATFFVYCGAFKFYTTDREINSSVGADCDERYWRDNIEAIQTCLSRKDEMRVTIRNYEMTVDWSTKQPPPSPPVPVAVPVALERRWSFWKHSNPT